MRRAVFLTLVFVWLGSACAPSSGSGGQASSPPSVPDQPARTVVMAIPSEPKTLAGRIIGQPATGGLIFARRLFNADLVLLDDQSNAYPYLAEALPQLNTDTWKVFPDGTMETIYHLRPGLVWHDGAPHTADDFVLSWQVYSTPQIGQSGSIPIRLIGQVEAPDDRTVLIRWKQPYAGAGTLQSLGLSAPIGLPPLPRHILGPALEAGADALVTSAYWTSGYIGLGPYRLDRWEPGSYLEASGFERHALGAPKINRLKVLFMTDANAVLASLLAGEIQAAPDQGLPLPQAMSFLRQRQPGEAIMVPSFVSWLAAHFQARTDYVSPAALRDVRVRQALAYAVDRDGINDGLYQGQFFIADSVFPPTSELGRAANAAAVKYPFDLARSAQLMVDAGFAKREGDFYVDANGGRFSAEIRSSSGSTVDAMGAIGGGWRQAGFDFAEYVVPAAQAQDIQVKSTYPGIQLSPIANGESGLNSMGSDSVPQPENQWRGNAWDGYSNPGLDGLLKAFISAVEPSQRVQAAADIAKLYSGDVPAISLFFPVTPWVFTSEVRGPKPRPAETNVAWNIHEWEQR